MDAANRDEGRRCLEKAKQALKSDSFADAKRLGEKSHRLCPSGDAQGKLVSDH